MHIISRKALRVFTQHHPDSKTALDSWFHKVYIRHILTHSEYDKGMWKE